VIDPTAAPGAVTTLSTLGGFPEGITTDGTFIWIANQGGSVWRVDPDSGATTNFTTGLSEPRGILFDGTNIWVSDVVDGKLKKLGSNGTVLQSVDVGFGSAPHFPVFDGSNIWVPNFLLDSVSVIRARDGQLLATLTGNGLHGPNQAAFDGQRILVTNSTGNMISLWKAADLTPLGAFLIEAGTASFGACSDGINFWITLTTAGMFSGQLARF